MEMHKSGFGSTAWRLNEPDAPGLFALVYNAGSMKIAESPETDRLTFVLFEGSVNDPVGTVQIGGRVRLNSWYQTYVGYTPDEEPDGPVPIMQLIENVATHLLLRYFEEGLLPMRNNAKK
jgi:hypothetical protein